MHKQTIAVAFGLLALNVLAHTVTNVEEGNASTESSLDLKIEGSLGLFIHEFEDGVDLEYCLLTPNDLQQKSIFVDLQNSFTQCYNAVSGVFTVTPQTNSVLNKDGCDTKYLPLCVDSEYLLKEAEIDEEASAQKKAAQDKVTGSRSILFIEMYYLDQSPPCTTSCIQQNMWGGSYNVDGLYNEASFGTLRFPQSSSLDVQLSMGTRVSDGNYCSVGPQPIRTEALNAMAQQYPSVVISNYNHMMMVTPALCGVAVSQVGGSILWVNSNFQDVFAHELGHNLGRRHASIDLTNTDPTSLASMTTDKEYGDLSCVMGYSGIGLRSFNIINRINLGWIPSSAIVVPPASCATSAVQYNLASAQLNADGTYGSHAIQIARAEGGFYYVSYRSGNGYDVNAPAGWKAAVFVHYSVGASSVTKFVKALQSGQTYTDSVTGFRVQVNSISSNSATVQVLCGTTSSASCNLQVATSAQSSLAGTFGSVSQIGGYNAWARSDLRAVVAYCASQTVWVIGAHDGSAAYNFNPCNNPLFKSSTQTSTSPTDVTSWYSCTSSSSCAQDSTAGVTLSSCSVSVTVPSASPASSPAAASPTSSPSPNAAATPSRTATVSPTRSRSATVSPTRSRSGSVSPTRSRSATRSRTGSRSPSHSPSHLLHAEVVSPSNSATHSRSRSPSPTPSSTSAPSVCPYFTSLCTKCQLKPSGVCTYLADLCADCM